MCRVNRNRRYYCSNIDGYYLLCFLVCGNFGFRLVYKQYWSSYLKIYILLLMNRVLPKLFYLSLWPVWTLLHLRLESDVVHTWQSLVQGVSIAKRWRVEGEQDTFARKHGGGRWSAAAMLRDALSCVCCGALMIKTSLCCGACTRLSAVRDLVCSDWLLPCLTTISWLFLSISICCLFSVRAANSLGFRQLFIFVFVSTSFSRVLAQS